MNPTFYFSLGFSDGTNVIHVPYLARVEPAMSVEIIREVTTTVVEAKFTVTPAAWQIVKDYLRANQDGDVRFKQTMDFGDSRGAIFVLEGPSQTAILEFAERAGWRVG